MQKFTGLDYLMIDIANNFGLDKKNWDVRIDWVKQNEHQLEDLVKKADEPALYFAGVRALRDAQQKIPSGYPISLDACSSGLQILSCLVGDRAAAKLCGVITTGNRENAYELVYKEMLNRVNSNTAIEPEKVKKAVMTALYGSEQVPKDVFGEGELLEVFHQVMSDLAPGAWELNSYFLNIWDPEAKLYSWILPDNFHVHTKVIGIDTEAFSFGGADFELQRKVNKPTESGRSIGANVTHSIDGYIVREIIRRCKFDKETVLRAKVALCNYDNDPLEVDKDSEAVETLWNHYKETNMLSARILDHINENNVSLIDDRAAIFKLIASFPAKPFEVITVHDCFRVLPNYGNDIRQQYNNLLAELADSNLLSVILSSITRRKIQVGKLDPNMSQEIRSADYTLS